MSIIVDKFYLKLGLLMLFATILISLISLEIWKDEFVSKSINSHFLNDENITEKIFTIAYPTTFPSFTPLSFDAQNRQIIINVFDSLVKFDANFELVSGLASSWGLLDDMKTYEFSLKEDVYFHNGDKFVPQDVLNSIEKVREIGDPSLKSFLANIDSVKVVSDNQIHITLKDKDPFFLSKLTAIYVFKETNQEPFVGTGPYVFASVNDDKVELDFYDKFYGDKAEFEKIRFVKMSDPEERVKSLENKEIDMALNLNSSYPESLIEKNKIQVFKMPTLDTYFIGFNSMNSIFKNINLRNAVKMALDNVQIEAIAGGVVSSASQFAVNGVFGFNPQIEVSKQDLDQAQSSFRKAENFKRLKITLDLSTDFEDLGNYIKSQLKKIGLDVTLNFFDTDKLVEYVYSGQSDFFILGWKHELGDVNDFLVNIVHSGDSKFGFYNASYYENSDVDQLIEKAQNLNDKKEIQSLLQKIMDFIVNEDLFGVPLFSTQILYGVQPYIDFTPRYDGYIVCLDIQYK